MLTGATGTYEGDAGYESLQHWKSADQYVTWFVDAPKPGDYTVEVTYSCSEANAGSDVKVRLGLGKDDVAGAAPLTLRVQDTGGWEQFKSETVGKLHVAAGRQTLSLNVKSKPHDEVMRMRQVLLTPAH